MGQVDTLGDELVGANFRAPGAVHLHEAKPEQGVFVVMVKGRCGGGGGGGGRDGRGGGAAGRRRFLRSGWFSVVGCGAIYARGADFERYHSGHSGVRDGFIGRGRWVRRVCRYGQGQGGIRESGQSLVVI